MSLQTNKINPKLGLEIHQHLKKLGVETPMLVPAKSKRKSDANRLDIIEGLSYEILQELNLDLNDDSLIETPKRMAKMYLQELFWGLNVDNFPKVTVVDNKVNYNEMVMERNITVHSTCEHHLLPIIGSAYVAYIPTTKVPGLSKINRIVEYFCRRPQIQERLTVQIYHTLAYLLETPNVAVCIDAEHMCVKTRGVEDACSDTVTTKLGGVFEQADQRQEFYTMINLGRK